VERGTSLTRLPDGGRVDGAIRRPSTVRGLVVAAVALLALTALCPPAALAQNERIFGETGLREQDLIDALERPPTARTRSIRTGAAPASASPGGSAGVMVTFDTDSTVLTSSARSALDVVARALNSDRLSGLSFSVEGHADPRGGADHNLSLSQARADAVVEYLSTTHNIDRARLRSVGRGDGFPVKPDDPAARENRRVTFVTQ
jgi:OOP family OmpA-OmpF porin